MSLFNVRSNVFNAFSSAEQSMKVLIPVLEVEHVQGLREVIPKKKPLTFGHCPKVALTLPPPTRFEHLWGNFFLNRFRTNIQLKTTSKQPKKNHKTTSKLPQNYPKTFGIGSPPPFPP